MTIDEHFHIYAISKDQKCQHVQICNKFSFLYHPQIPLPLLPALLGVQLLHLNLIQLGNLSPLDHILVPNLPRTGPSLLLMRTSLFHLRMKI